MQTLSYGQREVKYLSLSNQDAAADLFKDSADKEELQRSDLISGVYEGGLKVWECTLDMLQFISDKGADLVAGKRVLELGCGQGLPGIMCAKLGAASVLLQDYNDEVIKGVT